MNISSHAVYFSPHNLFLEAILLEELFLDLVIQILTVNPQNSFINEICLFRLFNDYHGCAIVFETRVFASAGLLMSILLAYFQSNEKINMIKNLSNKEKN